jgi:hypothetical protein
LYYSITLRMPARFHPQGIVIKTISHENELATKVNTVLCLLSLRM